MIALAAGALGMRSLRGRYRACERHKSGRAAKVFLEHLWPPACQSKAAVPCEGEAPNKPQPTEVNEGTREARSRWGGLAMFEMSIELATGWIALVAVIFLASMAGAELAANDVKPSRAEDRQNYE